RLVPRSEGTVRATAEWRCYLPGACAELAPRARREAPRSPAGSVRARHCTGPAAHFRWELQTYAHCEVRMSNCRDRLERCFAPLIVADADSIVYARQENLPVADIAGASCGRYRMDRLIHYVISHNHLQLQFRQQINRVLPPSIKFRMPFLSAVTADFNYGHALDPNLVECVLNCLKPGSLNNCHKFRHRVPLLLTSTAIPLTLPSNTPLPRAATGPDPGPRARPARGGRLPDQLPSR